MQKISRGSSWPGNGNPPQYSWDTGKSLGQARILGKAWEIPWTKEPHRYSPWDHKESDMTVQLSMQGQVQRIISFPLFPPFLPFSFPPFLSVSISISLSHLSFLRILTSSDIAIHRLTDMKSSYRGRGEGQHKGSEGKRGFMGLYEILWVKLLKIVKHYRT